MSKQTDDIFIINLSLFIPHLRRQIFMPPAEWSTEKYSINIKHSGQTPDLLSSNP